MGKTPLRSFLFRLLLSCLALGLPVAAANGAGTAGSIRGTVKGPDGKPLAAVLVQLRNDISGFKADTTTGREGNFQFFGIPFNPYELHVEVQGFKPVHRSLDVRTSIPQEVEVTLELAAVQESVSVMSEPTAAQLETDVTTSHVDIDKSFIQRVPAAIPMRAMEEIVTSTPGFALDENGRYHFQGAHSQSEYVIDGQTIADQTGVTFSNSIDPGIAQSLEIIYGNVPAEFGEKVGAVVNMTTKSGLGAPFKGTVIGTYGTFDTYQGGFSAGGGTDRFGVFASFNAAGSDHFADAPNPDYLHDSGDTQRGFLRLDSASPGFSNAFRLSALLGRTDREVPNRYTQEASGQAQSVQTYDQNYNFGWQNVLSASTVIDVTAFARLARFTLYPSAGDTPITAYSDRSLNNFGITPVFTWTAGIHEIKAGGVFKAYPIQENFRFGITDPTFNDPSSPDYNPNIAPYDLTRGGTEFAFADTSTDKYYAVFLQDTIRWKNLTASLGVRYENNNLPVTTAQWSPRLGVAYYIPQTGSVLRGTYSRIVYTPEFENVLLSSSAEAAAIVPPAVQDSRALGGGVLPVQSEKQNAYTVGIQQALGSRLRLDFDYWWRYTTNAGDQDQFLTTGIVFPISFASGHYQGWDLRLDLAPTAGFRGYVSAGHVHAIYVPPPAGGLFLDQGSIDAITGGPFLIDHDQKLQIQAGLYYDVQKTGLWLGANVRYDSGLVTDASPEDLVGDPDNAFAIPYIVVHSGTDLDPNRIKARTVCDFQIGYDLSRIHIPVQLQFMILNAFDTQGVYNILSVFGGTHVIPPRRFVGQALVTF
ncbi:MAG TPA: TonB-dependent receptor [Thermoanaerobaculia bacterium]|nr:TonB-dependent receptor [Thermoanaerobaculia bacterium]